MGLGFVFEADFGVRECCMRVEFRRLLFGWVVQGRGGREQGGQEQGGQGKGEEGEGV